MLRKIQIITAISFLLLYIDGDKISWFMFVLVPTMLVFTAGGASEAIIKIGDYNVLNAVVSTAYLISILLSVSYVFFQGLKNKLPNMFSIAASLFLFSIVFLLFSSAHLKNPLSIVGLTVFIISNCLSVVLNFQGIKNRSGI